MSERKVLNKYYPPDFDPTKLSKLKLPKERQYTVRMMTPFNMKCLTCGTYIAKAKKFNARKETVQNATYLNLKIFRFYIRCPGCMAEITFKTNPETTDYEMEHGAHRNFDALRLAELQEEAVLEREKEEERLNPMKQLENRTKQSREEMEELEKLAQLKEENANKQGVDMNELIELHRDEHGNQQKSAEQMEAERLAKEEQEVAEEARQLMRQARGLVSYDNEDNEVEEEVIEEPAFKRSRLSEPTTSGSSSGSTSISTSNNQNSNQKSDKLLSSREQMRKKLSSMIKLRK